MRPRDPGPPSDPVADAVAALHKAGLQFKGPFATSKGTLIQVEDQILTVQEVLDLRAKNNLTSNGVRELATRPRAKPKASGA